MRSMIIRHNSLIKRECKGEEYPISFYHRRPDIVARDLLGSIVASKSKSCIIVETEAYFGDCDPGSRASKYRGGRIRNRLFGDPGMYLIYGMHGWLLTNIVAHGEGGGGAVLIRSCLSSDGEIIEGPGKVSRFLEVSMDYDGVKVGDNGSPRILCGYKPKRIVELYRVNVRVDFEKPLRYACIGVFKPRIYKPKEVVEFTLC